MVYSPTPGSDYSVSDPQLQDSNFLYLSYSTLYSSPLWRTDTIIFSKLNKAPLPFTPVDNKSPWSA